MSTEFGYVIEGAAISTPIKLCISLYKFEIHELCVSPVRTMLDCDLDSIFNNLFLFLDNHPMNQYYKEYPFHKFLSIYVKNWEIGFYLI